MYNQTLRYLHTDLGDDISMIYHPPHRGPRYINQLIVVFDVKKTLNLKKNMSSEPLFLRCLHRAQFDPMKSVCITDSKILRYHCTTQPPIGLPRSPKSFRQ